MILLVFVIDSLNGFTLEKLSQEGNLNESCSYHELTPEVKMNLIRLSKRHEPSVRSVINDNVTKMSIKHFTACLTLLRYLQDSLFNFQMQKL